MEGSRPLERRSGVARGLQVSRGDILENLFLQRQLGHQPLLHENACNCSTSFRLADARLISDRIRSHFVRDESD
jgi:hypothetical protein